MSEETTKLKVKYETTTSQFASQCVLNSKEEVVFLQFASDLVPDPESGKPVLPIHTRITMTTNGLIRLRDMLNKALPNPTGQGSGPRPKIAAKSSTKKEEEEETTE